MSAGGAANAPPARVYRRTARGQATLSGGVSIERCSAVVELGMDVAAFREKARDGGGGQEETARAGTEPDPRLIPFQPGHDASRRRDTNSFF